jgi:hypothetical protein
MRRIIQLLKKLFSKGGTLRNGRKVMPNPTKLNRVTEFEKLVAQEGSEFEQSYEKLDKSTKSDYIKKLHTGKLTPKQVIEKIKLTGRKIKARAVTPIGYNLTKPFAIPLEILLPKIGPKYQSLRNRYDAWYIYNNVPQKYNSMLKLGTHTDGRPVYSIKNFTVAKNDIDAIIRNPKQSDIGTSFNFGGVHGNGAAYKGVDKKGKYIVFYDLWDLQPLKAVANRIGTKLKLPKKQMDKIGEWEVGGNPFWTKNKVYYDDAGNIFRADGKTPLYSVKGTMYRDIVSAPDQAMLNVKNVKRRRAALQRLGKKQVTVLSTEPITPETLDAMLGEWGTHIKYSKIKSGLPIAIGAGTITYIGLDALVSYLSDKDDEQREKIGQYMMKNKLSQKDLNDKLLSSDFQSNLNKKLGLK